MYNQEQKEAFVRDYTTSVSYRAACISVFNFFEPYEVKWGADLCTRSTQELQPVMDEALGMRGRSKHLRVNILRDYVKWCIDKGVSGACDGMMHINTDGIDKMKRHTVKNPFHLQVCLDQICDPESEDTIDNTYRCFYWIAYAGANEEDIFEIRTSDVDLQNMVIRHGEDEYPIYREAIPAIRKCMELTRFVYKHPNYAADTVAYKDRIDGDMLIRGVRGTTIPSTRVALSRLTKKAIESGKTEMKLSYYRVWISGVFYRMFERENAGLPVSFDAVAYQVTDGKTYKLDSGRNTIAAYRKKVAREYKHDYDNWKLTF